MNQKRSCVCVRFLAAGTLCSGFAASAGPDQTTHRTSPTPVLWTVAEPSVNLAAFAQKLSSSSRPGDFEFQLSYGDFDSVRYIQQSYHSIDVEATAPYEIDDMIVVGPGAPSDVIQFLNLNSYRPVDIEYDYLNDPPVMTAVAVPNTGDNFAQWSINTAATEQEIHDLVNGFPFAYRPVDIEFSGISESGGTPLYAVLSVINASFAATGFTTWDARFNMTKSDLLFFQQSLGRILDFEIQNNRPYNDPRWDAIFIPWDEDRPVYNHVASLASPAYADNEDRQDIPRYFTNEFDPEVNDFEFDLPGLTAGFRLSDIEYYFYYFGLTPYIQVDGTFVDAATPLQFFVRDQFAAASEGPLQSTDKCAFDMAEIGADTEFLGVHTKGRPATLSSSTETSVPAHMPILAAYAVLNDDLDLTEQQLFTCDPSACPPPTTICDPELFTVRQLLERMRDLQDYSSAQTLIEERYLAVNIDSFIQMNLDPTAPFVTQYLIDASFPSGGLRYCDADISLAQLTSLIEMMTDGTLGDAQSREDFLEYMFAPSPQALDDAIDAIIDDEASEYDLTPAQVQAFKDTMTRRWRELSVDTLSTVNGTPNTAVNRRAGFAFMGVPEYDPMSQTTSLREFSINSYLESVSGDAAPLYASTAEALRDAIANALDAWTSRPAGCNEADLAEAFGELDFTDVIAFISAFGADDPLADLAAPFGTLDFTDILAFLTAFNAGCP